MLMKLRIIPFKGSWLRIISYRHYEKMKKRNHFVNCQKHLHWIHLNFRNDVESRFRKLKIFWLHRCWWRMLETKCVGDKFEMLLTDLIHWENRQHNEKVANIMIVPPTSQISHHHKVTNITMSPTSLSPLKDPILYTEK